MRKVKVQPGDDYKRTAFIKKVNDFLESVKEDAMNNKDGLGIIFIAVDVEGEEGQMICGGMGSEDNLTHMADLLSNHEQLGKHFKGKNQKAGTEEAVREAIRKMTTNN